MDKEVSYKYVVYLNGEAYCTTNSEDEANRIEAQLYASSNMEDDFQSYYGNFIDVEVKKVRA